MNSALTSGDPSASYRTVHVYMYFESSELVVSINEKHDSCRQDQPMLAKDVCHSVFPAVLILMHRFIHTSQDSQF